MAELLDLITLHCTDVYKSFIKCLCTIWTTVENGQDVDLWCQKYSSIFVIKLQLLYKYNGEQLYFACMYDASQ